MTLHPLLELQRIDSNSDALCAEREGLPERAALADNQVKLARLAAEQAATRDALVALRREEHRIEGEVAELRDQATEVETTLYSGSVSAVSELEGLQAKLSSLREQQAELEEAELELLEQVETREAELAQHEASQAEIEEQNEGLAKTLEAGEARIDGLLAGVAREREAHAPAVAAPVLSVYDRLRMRGSERLKGVVASPLEEGVCGACHTSLPVTLARKIRAAEATEVFHCESCQRILVAPV